MAKNETKTTGEKASTANSTSEKPSSEKVATASGTSEKPLSQKEPVYCVDEFCNNAKILFQTKPECVRAALREKGIEQCTKVQAQSIVSAFMKKEVK